MEQTWTDESLNKAEWGEGPWVNEPDKIVWVDEATNFDCMINRGPLGALCGYVGVPNTHPAYGKDSMTVDLYVHGGITFADKCSDREDTIFTICHVPQPGRPHDIWWLGFDCAHSGDIVPAMDFNLRGRGMRPLREMHPESFPNESYKDIPYVRQEITDLAKQLVEFE